MFRSHPSEGATKKWFPQSTLATSSMVCKAIGIVHGTYAFQGSIRPLLLEQERESSIDDEENAVPQRMISVEKASRLRHPGCTPFFRGRPLYRYLGVRIRSRILSSQPLSTLSLGAASFFPGVFVAGPPCVSVFTTKSPRLIGSVFSLSRTSAIVTYALP
ncbi:hypothetical protein BDV98DRAFT_309434 [Pterulicium gracile]|uniref:Uncharacterized protein n=1 Tax=Pterulicium gracile TaxID=1884261 RepID=A0A5C3QD34_9AGAR|nr:hypothetical protein BDV98DRAFT_309434 [Pterula gracilis]